MFIRGNHFRHKGKSRSPAGVSWCSNTQELELRGFSLKLVPNDNGGPTLYHFPHFYTGFSIFGESERFVLLNELHLQET